MRIARSTGVISGVLIALLGIWGALIPFVGPYFDYSFAVNSAWHYTSDRLWLDILPGAMALLGGLLIVLAATRPAGVFGGWLALLAGAWYVIGPAVSLTWEHGTGPIGRPLFGTTRQALELIGYFYGLGALIIALAAFSIGRFTSRPRVVEEPAAAGIATGAASAPAAAAPAAADAHDGAAERRRLRLRLRRRRGDAARPEGREEGAVER
jgi:hypothetical protein